MEKKTLSLSSQILFHASVETRKWENTRLADRENQNRLRSSEKNVHFCAQEEGNAEQLFCRPLAVRMPELANKEDECETYDYLAQVHRAAYIYDVNKIYTLSLARSLAVPLACLHRDEFVRLLFLPSLSHS
jgi:hypothetical protein